MSLLSGFSKYLVIPFLLIYHTVLSHDINWYKGVVVTVNQEVLIGEVSIQSVDLLLFRNNQTTSVYPAHKVQSVRFYDQHADIVRKFLILKDVKSGFNRNSFYEIVVSGYLYVVRQQKGDVNYSTNSDVFDFDYFIVNHEELLKVQNFKQKLFSELMANSPRLHNLIKTERLDPNNTADVIRMIKFYNSNIPQSLSI